MRVESKPIAKLLAYQERFKAKRSADSQDYEYFVMLHLIIPSGYTVSNLQIRESLENNYEMIYELLRRA